MVICSSQDAPSLARLHHRNLLNTPFPSMLQDTSNQKSNNYKLQCCALPMSDFWSCAITLLGASQHTREKKPVKAYQDMLLECYTKPPWTENGKI